MSNTDKLREIAVKWCPWSEKTSFKRNGKDYVPFDQMVSDLNALISEHYVSREEYDEEKKSNSLLHKAMVTAEKGGHDKAMEEISEHYTANEEVDKLLQQRDELKEALAEQKRLYFNLFDEEVGCMYCEAKLKRGSAIILCKECAESTEV